MRVRLFIALVLALLLFPSAAGAKGASEATITGAGLDQPITLDLQDHAGGASSLPTLADRTGFFEGIYPQEPSRVTQEAPTGDLGPMLVIDWRMPTSATEVATIRQEIFPYAAGGPMVHTPAGQAIHPEQRPTIGGWFRASIALTTMLQELGVPDQATLEQAVAAAADAAPAAVATAPELTSPSSGPSTWVIALVVAVALAVVALSARLGMARRRTTTAVAAT